MTTPSSKEMTAKESELKPCPFCGIVPRIGFDGTAYFISCGGNSCLIRLSISMWDKTETIAAWNTRAAAQPDGWIAVSERLPEPGVNVLIISMNFQTHSQHYTAYRSEPMTDDSPTFWRDSHTGAQTIFATHWCPLPTPPVQEKV